MFGNKRGFKRLLATALAVVLLIGVYFTGSLAEIKVYAYDKGYPNTWKNTGNQIEDLIGVALTQVGYWGTEYGTGTKYGAWYGNTYAPWCGMFISWCANQAGIPTSVILKSAKANDYKNSGTYHYKDDYTPKRGDIVLYNPNDGAGYYFPSKDSSGKYTRSQHVAIVCSYNAATDEITIVHGNGTADKVCHEKKKVRSNKAIQAFVTPNYTTGSTSSGGGSSSSSTTPKGDYINGSGVRLRSKMSTSSDIVATLNKNTSVKILSSANDSSGKKWYHIEVPSINKKGYVYGIYVTAVDYKEKEDTNSSGNSINSDNIRLRDGPSTSGTKTLTYLYKGQAVNVVSKHTDSNGDIWYKVSLTKGGTSYTGYVYGKYVDVKSLPSDIPTINENADTVSQNSVNLRKSASTDAEIVTMLSNGQVVKITAAAYDSKGDVWYKVTLKKDDKEYSGYIFSELVSLKTDKSSIKFENARISISFNANGGSGEPESVSSIEGGRVTIPSTFPKKSGYIFSGWAEGSGSSEKEYSVSASYEFSTNTTLYAVWLSSEVFGSYDVDNDLLLSDGDTDLLRKQLAKVVARDSKTDYNSDGKINAADLGLLRKKLSTL